MNSWKLPILLTAILAISGCSPSTSQVGGKVSFEDGSALAFGRVTFTPKSGPKGFWAPLTNDGTFVVDAEMVPMAGEYTVTIVGAEEPAFFETDPATGANKLVEAPKPLISENYAKAGTSPLTATVKPGKNELSFKVDKLP